MSLSPLVHDPVVSGPWSRSCLPWLPLALFSVLWLDLIRQLSYQWSNREQYAYGWFVPLLALGLFVKKWPTRPMPSSPYVPKSLSPCVPESVVSSPFLLSAFCFLLLPLRVIHEINQDWPLITWPLALIVVFLTLYAFHLAAPPSAVVPFSFSAFQRFSFLPSSPVSSPLVRVHSAFCILPSAFPFRGPSVPKSQCPRVPKSAVRGHSAFCILPSAFPFRGPWLRHFAFPICFILVAVAWPYRIEHGLTQGLMHAVTALTVTGLGWADILASQHGNVIEICTGVVGIDEACSGIRSFQSMIMAALFLGELYRLRWPYRLALIGSGVVVAFGLNVVRTFILTWRASEIGIDDLKKWHDPAGLAIFGATFACLFLLAWRIKKLCTALDQAEAPGYMPPPPLAPEAAESGVRIADCGLRIAESGVRPSDLGLRTSHPALQPSAFRFQPSALRFMAAAGLCSLCTIAVTELWYRAHNLIPVQQAHWWVSYPTNLPSFHEASVPDRARKLLKYDQCAGGTWNEPDGTSWSAYCFRWRTGDPTARMSALGHRPEYCLPSTGHELKSDLGTKYFRAADLELPFHAYIFEESQCKLYVFTCLWEDGAERQAGFGRSKYSDRLRSVLAGRRGLGQQTMEVAISGCTTMAEAERALHQRLPDLVRLEPAQTSRRAERKGFSLSSPEGAEG